MGDPSLSDGAYGTVILAGLSWLGKEIAKGFIRLRETRNGGTIETRVERRLGLIADETKATRVAIERHDDEYKQDREVIAEHRKALADLATGVQILLDRDPRKGKGG